MRKMRSSRIAPSPPASSTVYMSSVEDKKQTGNMIKCADTITSFNSFPTKLNPGLLSFYSIFNCQSKRIEDLEGTLTFAKKAGQYAEVSELDSEQSRTQSSETQGS
ncbi:hypothetical protein AMECASPLE_035379 [Ameca splendens]|uniref:Uncharacterized protein n=1 Tax=Ameca splendens TaxID=208324 RepID=A0ABV0ZIL1_9TELE